MKQETQCVHSGKYRDPATRGVNTPIFTSSAYEYLDREECPYPRYFNTVNQETVLKKLCALEGAEAGVLFSSGMAALTTGILTFAAKGDHVILLDELYSGTHMFATDQFRRFGIEYTLASTDADAIGQAIRPNTSLIVIESPTNPLMKVLDIGKVARIARERDITTMMDNTFASPVNQNPLALGIDVVVHSGTKYLGGHSDICCGAALTSREHALKIRHLARQFGGSLNAATCYLLERSLKTLALRVRQQTANAGRIAAFLKKSTAVRRVHYPGLADFPGHELARVQMKDFGAMLAFELDTGKIQPEAFIRKLTLITPAVSLGGLETTICAPAATSHAILTPEERERMGITDALFRLSVGIENAGDLVKDLEEALG